MGNDWTVSYYDSTEDYLAHHGILGQKWGIRRFQNPDGSLTTEGKAHRRGEAAARLAGSITTSARNASTVISTAARKKFNPSAQDLDDMIKKEKEKQQIEAKKKQLRELKNANKKKDKDIDDMTDEEVYREIQSRRNRATLENMRKQDDIVERGRRAIGKPLQAISSIASDTAYYAAKEAGKSLVDQAIYNANKKNRWENRSDAEKLEDERRMTENKIFINNADVRSESEKSRYERETAENRYQKDVLSANNKKSDFAADRLRTLKQVRSGGGGGNNNQNSGNNKKNRKKNH